MGIEWYRRLFFPLLRQMEAETAHERTLRALARAQQSGVGRRLLRGIAGEIPHRPVSLWGLTFPNVLGVAAGFDKDARVVPGLALLGFGHVEVGTVTPWPQPGNPRPRLFRLPAEQALINRLGFPSAGMVAVTGRLRQLAATERPCIVGVSLGKQRTTPLEEAATDYISVMRSVYPHADYLAINVSSPNTPGLRRLQTQRYLSRLLTELVAENQNLAYLNQITARPLLVKISPDLTAAELDRLLDVVLAHRVDGVIATNTTLSREGLSHAQQRQEGGLSGRPLRKRSTAIVAHIARYTGGRLPVIAAGGVRSAADVREKVEAGAALVQLYTGLVYGGPGLAGRVLRSLG